MEIKLGWIRRKKMPTSFLQFLGIKPREEVPSDLDLDFRLAVLIFDSSWVCKDTVYYGNRESSKYKVELLVYPNLIKVDEVFPGYHYVVCVFSPHHDKLKYLTELNVGNWWIDIKLTGKNYESCIIGEINKSSTDIVVHFKPGLWKNLPEITRYLEKR